MVMAHEEGPTQLGKIFDYLVIVFLGTMIVYGLLYYNSFCIITGLCSFVGYTRAKYLFNPLRIIVAFTSSILGYSLGMLIMEPNTFWLILVGVSSLLSVLLDCKHDFRGTTDAISVILPTFCLVSGVFISFLVPTVMIGPALLATHFILTIKAYPHEAPKRLDPRVLLW